MRPTITFSSNLANSYEIVKLAASLADLSVSIGYIVFLEFKYLIKISNPKDSNDIFKEIDIIAEKCTKSSTSIDILKENRINFVIKYIADCCHFMVLDVNFL